MEIRNYIGFFFCMHFVFASYTEHLFSNFTNKYKKNYVQGSEEYRFRYQIFKKNLEKQELLNSKRNHSKSAWYGPTQFSDLTEKEFAEKYLLSFKSNYQPPKIDDVEHIFNIVSGQDTAYFAPYIQLPSKIDWRDKNIVTSVKNQGSCGGCWAFSVVGTVESMYANKTGILQSFSVQEVLDCSYAYKKILSGCRGGDTCTALSWLMEKNITLVPEKKYPTVDKPEECKFSSIIKSTGAKVKNYTCLSYVNREDLLLQVLANIGPVSVSVDATNWNNYQGGIIQYHCGQAPNNHAVEIVGYDKTGEIPYYIVKNSWGTAFGHDGYVYIMIGGNVCGLVQEVSTVEVE